MSYRFLRSGRVGAAGIFAPVALALLTGAVPASSDAVPVPGNAQSPIDLRERDITFVRKLPPVRFNYPRTADVTLVNTGSPDENATVRADVPAGAAHIVLGGARYDLLQFHWHTPFEHELEGRDTPLEVHFVHRRADGSLLVVGVFIERGRRSRELAPIFSDLPEHAGETGDLTDVKLRDLLPAERDSFRYEGSLTTPPFTEGVQWIVLADPITLSKRQIQAFRELFEEGNSRETQPLNGRTVLSDAGDVDDG
jgi:carbonic anhydrase